MTAAISEHRGRTARSALHVGQGRVARRGGFMLLGSSIAAQASALLRYIIMARMLGPQGLGLAAALTVTAGFFDMISDTGSDRFIIQDRDGGKANVQKLVQLVFVSRGILVSLALVVFAVPVAQFYESPRLAPGLVLLAISPLIFGFAHLDVGRMQREQNFRPAAICIIVAEAAGLVAAAAAAWVTRDFTAVAYSLIVRSAVKVGLSHVLAERPYRIGWDAQSAPRLKRFAMPLLMNGLMLFILSQGDRLIIGHRLGLTSLGYYSTIMLLIYYPSGVIGGYIHAIFVPMISASRDSFAEQNRLSERLGGQTLMLSIAMAIGFAIVAPPLVPILFGSRFTQPALLIGLIGVLQAMRFFLSWPTTVYLAMGRSATLLISNLVHFLVFPAAFIGLWLMNSLTAVVLSFIVAEFIAVAVAMMLLNRMLGRRIVHGADRIAMLVLICVWVVAWNLAWQAQMWLLGACMVPISIVLLIWIYRREADVINEALVMVRRSHFMVALLRCPVTQTTSRPMVKKES